MKRALRTALLVLLLSAVGMGKGYAYHFSAICPTGQTLYYKIIDYNNYYVCLTYPGYNAYTPWEGYTKPTENIILPNSVTYGGITYTVKSIDNNAFSNCSSLTGDLTIPNTVTSINSGAFQDCSGFTGSLTIPSSVSFIEDGAFSGCGFTGSLSIPGSVSLIGTHPFKGNHFEQIVVAPENSFYDSRGNCNAIIRTGDNYLITGCKNTVIPNSVTEIAWYAFSGCGGFTGSLTIPNSVTSIGKLAFEGCTFNGLNIDMIEIPSGVIDEYNNHQSLFYYIGGNCTGSLTIGNSVVSIGEYAFTNCGFTDSLTIGNSVTTIGKGAFSECRGFIGSLTIPNSVTTIGEGAFADCSGFTGSFTIPNSVTTIEYATFLGCSGFTGDLVIPNSVTTIGNAAFLLCNGFRGSLIIPNSVTSIGEFAFMDCSGFTGNLTIPNSITTIDYCTFCNCSGFTGSLTIPDSVTSIDGSAFQGCSGLTSIMIPSSVTEIGTNPFPQCSGLEQIVVAPGNSFYDSRENCNAIIRTSDNTLVTGCKNTVISNSVSTIGNYAFYACTGLTGSLTIPNSVTTIGNEAFVGCIGFTGSLTIGNSVTEIGWSAFADCSSFTSITSLATTPPNLGSYAFEGVTCTTLTVPCNCIPTYEASDWATHFSTIVEDCSSHSISIDDNSFNGGNVSASVNSTNLGEEVILTITPNEGMALASLTVSNANDPSQTVPVYPISKGSYTYGFLMPPYDVVVKAVFVEGTAIGESNSIVASVYPNPTNGQVKIEAEDLKQITISNMLGQVIYEGKASGNEFAYDFSQHGEGVYLIRIETASGLVTKRVVVTR